MFSTSHWRIRSLNKWLICRKASSSKTRTRSGLPSTRTKPSPGWTQRKTFFQKFRSLRDNGCNTRLNILSQDGKLLVSLAVELEGRKPASREVVLDRVHWARPEMINTNTCFPLMWWNTTYWMNEWILHCTLHSKGIFWKLLNCLLSRKAKSLVIVTFPPNWPTQSAESQES